MGLPGHPHTHFIKSGISKRDGGIAIVQQLINLLSLLQTCQRTILPEDRCHIRNRAEQPLMPAAQTAMTELQTLIQNFPEFLHITLSGTGHINQIDRDYSLIEPPIEFVRSVRLHL